MYASSVEDSILTTTDHQAKNGPVDNVGSVTAQVQAQNNRLPQQKANESHFDRAEADARAIQHIQDRENIFAAELVDGRWAIDAINKFQADLTSFEGAKFKLANIDCRSTTCRALLNFESYASAQAQSRQLAERAYSYNCAKEIVMPQTADVDVPYQATLYLDCRKLRSTQR